MKRAIFPDSKSLQPPPQNIYPNISGNINSTTKSLPISAPNQNIQSEQNNISNTQQNNTNQSTYIPYVILTIVIFLIIWGVKKIREEVNAEIDK